MDLCYGDVVILRDEDTGGFLQAEGLRDARLWLREPFAFGGSPTDYEGCLFQLLPMLQYAARREEQLIELAPATDAAGAGSALRRMRTRAHAEAGANLEKIAAWTGQPVMCGHIVQLRHIRSSKLVSLSSRALAPYDESCTLAQLTEAGSMRNWLQIEPTSTEQARSRAHAHRARRRPLHAQPRWFSVELGGILQHMSRAPRTRTPRSASSYRASPLLAPLP